MLAWVARRATSAGTSTAPITSQSARSIKTPLLVPHAARSSLIHSTPLTQSSFNSLRVREYAKIVKKVKKSVVKKQEPQPIYDEDLEDDSVVHSDAIEIEDYTAAEKNNPEYLQSAIQMEETLRSTLPPELVDRAIADHRQALAAHKSGSMSNEDASRFGFTPRLSPAELEAAMANLTSSASSKAPSASTGATSSASTASTDSSTSPISSKAAAPSASATTLTSKSSSGTKKMKLPKSAKSVTEEEEYDDEAMENGLEATKSSKGVAKRRMKMMKDAMKLAEYQQKAKKAAAEADLWDNQDADEDLDLARREAKIEELRAKYKAKVDPKNEPLLHQRMERLRNVIIGHESADGDEVATKLIEKNQANLASVSAPKRPKVTLKSNPESVSKAARQAKDLMAKGKWQEALAIYEDLVTLTSNHALLSAFAIDAWKANQMDVAGQAAISVFNREPSDARANMVAARALLHQFGRDFGSLNSEMTEADQSKASKQLAMALQHVDRALETHSDSPDLLCIKGCVYSGMRKYKTASAFFKSAISEFDRQKFPRAARTETYREYGKALAGRGRYTSAKKYLELAHSIEPKNVETIALLAELFERGFEDLEGAAPYYRLAVQTNPEDVPSLVRLGQLFSDPNYSGQNLPQARQCYERAMMLQPLPDFWFPLGWLSVHMNENDRALTCLQRAAELDPSPENRWTSLVLMAEVYAFDSAEGSIDRAIQLYEHALELKSDTSVKLNLAKCFLRIGDANAAEELVSEIRDSNPDNSEIKCILVEAYWLAGKSELAHEELDRVIAEHPFELPPQFMKGKYLYEDGDYERAVGFLERSVDPVLNPSSEHLNKLNDSIQALGKEYEKENPEAAAVISQQFEQMMAQRAEEEGMNEEQGDALSDFGTMIAPDFAAEALYLLSKCHFAAQRWSEAKRVTIYALKFDAENAQLLEALGEAHLHLDERAEAIETLRKASVFDRSAARPSFRLGNLYAESSQPEQALTYYERALEALETHIKARNSQSTNEKAESGAVTPEEGFSDLSQSTVAAPAVPRKEQISASELPDMLYAIHSNMAACYEQLAAHDRANYAKYIKSANASAQLAQEVRSWQAI